MSILMKKNLELMEMSLKDPKKIILCKSVIIAGHYEIERLHLDDEAPLVPNDHQKNVTLIDEFRGPLSQA
jgi:hypothetical protein